MNITKALKRLHKQALKADKCIQSKTLGCKIAMVNNELYTVSSCGIGRGLKMSYRHLTATDWKIVKPEVAEIKLLYSCVKKTTDTDKARLHRLNNMVTQ